MAALLPGAESLDAYWSNLVKGVDAITDVPPNRWEPDIYYDPRPTSQSTESLYCRRGGFVDGLATFEPLQFGMMPNSLKDTEPDQLTVLTVADAALQDAGGRQRLVDRSRVGVFIGRVASAGRQQMRLTDRFRTSRQLAQVLHEILPELSAARVEAVRRRFVEQIGQPQPGGLAGTISSLIAARVANRLDLGGPTYTLDAACASSLVVVDQAVTELATGRLDVVLAGGVHHVHDPAFWSLFCHIGALSRQEQCRPFDRRADGMLIGEGTGVVVLKRLADARRDGDRIYAVIRGCGTSSDGQSSSLWCPNSTGQTVALRRAWQMAGLDPTAADAVGLLEAHGTATPAGDIAELNALRDFFGPTQRGRAPVIGSVKSMIGHTMGAAGIAGLIKAALAVHHGQLLPTLHCDDPVEALGQTRFTTISSAEPWVSDSPRRAAVSAFGFGGINAHVVLEEHVDRASRMVATGRGLPTEDTTVLAPTEMVVQLSAADAAAMARLLDQDNSVLRSLASSSRIGTGGCRLAVFDPTDARLDAARRVVRRGRACRGARDIWFTADPLLADGDRASVAFVYPGLEPEFDPQVADLAAWQRRPAPDFSTVTVTRHVRSLMVVGEILTEALRRVGVEPGATAGHSVGEWSSATASGQIPPGTMDRFLEAFADRSFESGDRVFAAIGAGVETIVPMLSDHPGVTLSHDNAPQQVLVNGPEAAVRGLVVALHDRHIISRLLPFQSAFHTPMFAVQVPEPATLLRDDWRVDTPRVPVWSSTLAAPYPTDPQEVTDLFLLHMSEPVLFRTTVQRMHDSGIRAFIQMGPGQLSTLIRDSLRGREHLAVAANVPHRSGADQLLRTALALWVEGYDVDVTAFAPPPAAAHPVAVGLRTRSGPVEVDLSTALVSMGRDAAELLGPRPPASADEQTPSAGPPVVPEERSRVTTVAPPAGALVAPAAPTGGRPPATPAAATDALLAIATALREDGRHSSAASEFAAMLGEADSTGDTDAHDAAPPRIHHLPLHVSVASMPHLLDHCFFRQPAAWPNPVDRWPVLPATGIIAHMMDAVLQVAPGTVVIAVRAARFKRWVTAEPSLDVDISVERIAPNNFDVHFGEFAQAMVEVAETYPPVRPEPWLGLPDEHPRVLTADQIFDDRLLFHGNQYRGMTEVHAMGAEHVLASIVAKPAPGALLDATLQLTGYWTAELGPHGYQHLPVAFGDIRFYAPPPAAGSRLLSAMRVRKVTESDIRYSTQIIDGGAVLAQINDGLNRLFEVPERVSIPERFPERTMMSDPQPEGWMAAFDPWPTAASHALAARRVLGTEGIEAYHRQPMRGRRSWLLGRIAAQDAVRTVLSDTHPELYPIEVTVSNDVAGCPRVSLAPGRAQAACDVSIAHCGEAAVAIARRTADGSDGAAGGIGIDLTEITERATTTELFAMSDAERHLLDGLVRAGGDRPTWFATVWAAKEAVAKARGTGLDGRPRDFVVTDVDGEVLTVRAMARTYQVRYRVLRNPPGMAPRQYAVAWTWGPEAQAAAVPD